jgi:hypothetical protein
MRRDGPIRQAATDCGSHRQPHHWVWKCDAGQAAEFRSHYRAAPLDNVVPISHRVMR